MTNRKLKTLKAWALAGGAMIALTGGAIAQDTKKIEFSIAAQDLGEALTEFGVQSGADVLFKDSDIKGKLTDGVNGAYTTDQAIEVLLDESGVNYLRNDSGTLLVGETYIRQSELRDGRFRVAQLDQEDDRALSNDSDPRGADEDEPDVIVVTGSNIRGVSSASPVSTYTREEIDLTGVSSVPEFVQTLPQNFGGGISESTFGVVLSGNTNINDGTGVNLRGLGNDSTLVLLNGRRLAPAGNGNFVDISMIPLAAIDRVEVLTDGASAVYGSDAVGGVVNFIMRNDYDGAETRVRYGTATSGDLDNVQISQTFGKNWGSGNALISYEFQKRDSLNANDRDFSQDADDPQDLLPTQERHSVFLTGSQDIGASIEIFGDGFFSNRNSASLTANSSFQPEEISRSTDQYGVSVGSRVALSDTWQAEVIGAFNQSDVSGDVTNLETAAVTEISSRTSKTWTVDGKVDGSFVRLPGGYAKLAVGGQYRREIFEGIRLSSGADLGAERDVYAVFGEVFIPLVSNENAATGIERLEITVAGRFEDYSDFGSSTDPKVGLLWSPVHGLNIRGTWGTSFRAPLFVELDTSTEQGFLFDLPDAMAADGTTLTVLAFGNNADLEPETSTNWTVGFDLQPVAIPGLNIQTTYFEIDFENRIDSVFAFFDALTDPRFDPVVDRNPDQELLARFETLPFSANFAPGFAFTDAEAFFDGRLRNLSRVKTRGLDFATTYSVDSDFIGVDGGVIGINFSGTYLFEQLQQIIDTDDPFDVVGLAFNPPDLSLRGGASFNYDGFGANVAVNFIDEFRNEQVDPAEVVDSWTTVDLNLNYGTGDNNEQPWLNGIRLSINVLNLFDEDPPFVTSFFSGEEVNFDPTNASPVGRTIAFQITKNW